MIPYHTLQSSQFITSCVMTHWPSGNVDGISHGWDFPRCNFKLLLMIYILSISCETLRRMWQDLLDEVGIGSGKGLVPSGNKPSPELTWYKSSKNISKLHIFLTVNFPNPRTNELNFCYWLRNAVVLSYQFIHPNAIFVTFPFAHGHMIQV